MTYATAVAKRGVSDVAMGNQRTAECSRYVYKDRRDALKILFINLPYYGHFIPTVGLVQELIELGHKVTYMMPYG